MAERGAAREPLQPHVQVVARLARERRGADLAVELVGEVAHAGGGLLEDLRLDRDELREQPVEMALVGRHRVGEGLARDELAADAPVLAQLEHLEHLRDRQAGLGGAGLVHGLVEDVADLVFRPEDLQDRGAVAHDELAGALLQDLVARGGGLLGGLGDLGGFGDFGDLGGGLVGRGLSV